jgi:DNA mismatch endonuclease Vsr
MRIYQRTPSFRKLKSSSLAASAAARSSSIKTNTRCERVLYRALSEQGFVAELNPSDVLGKPDLVFRSARLAIFVDGDFWHGRNLNARLRKLAKGHNSQYWQAKILTNVWRDTRLRARLRRQGWAVLRVWETDITKNVARCASRISRKLSALPKRPRCD